MRKVGGGGGEGVHHRPRHLSTQLAAHSLQHTACSTQLAAHSLQHTAFNTELSAECLGQCFQHRDFSIEPELLLALH